MSIGIIGAGAWGSALAHVLSSDGSDVLLWSRSGREKGTTVDLAATCARDVVLCVTPAQTVSDMSDLVQPHLGSDSRLVLCAKGIDRSSGKLLHEIATERFGADRVAALSGPSFAEDVMNGLPTAVSLAAYEMDHAKNLAAVLARPKFRPYASDDLVGVEIGGALKNVLALAVGAARGLNLGASAEAALIARGFAEMTRLAIAKGAQAETLSGLSGLGDLVLSCSSLQSRNFSYGVALGRDESLENRPLAEGVHSASMAQALAREFEISAPIIDMVVAVLDKEISAQEAVSLLLARPLKEER